MKKKYISICLLALLFSCSQKETSEKESETIQTAKVDTVSKEQAAEDAAFKKKRFEEYLPDFKELVISYDGVVRGIDIGMTSEEVQKKETAILTTTAKDKLIFVLELSEDESAEITYFLENGKVNGIEYAIGQGTSDEVSAFILEFTDYFTNKYGPVVPGQNDAEVWKTPSGHEITVLDISKDKRYGLKIVVKK